MQVLKLKKEFFLIKFYIKSTSSGSHSAKEVPIYWSQKNYKQMYELNFFMRH
jgi:hypothetical protein